MNWYLTKIVFRILYATDKQKAQFDEQLRIIMAPDPQTALDKTRRFAEDETNFISSSDMAVKWQFVNVTEIYRINNYIDGAEIFSQLSEEENGDLYEEKINRKAANTLQNIQNRILEIY
jgi:Domain of unknown function (DUF4288)